MAGGLEGRKGSQDHQPSKNSVQKTISCNSTSNALVDGRIYPKHVELRIHQYKYLVVSSWHFTLFHSTSKHNINYCNLYSFIREIHTKVTYMS